MDENSSEIEYKTKKIGLWIAVITLVGLIIGLITQLIPIFSTPSIPEMTEDQIKIETDTLVDSKKEQSPLPDVPPAYPSKPFSSITYDTVHLLLDSRLSHNSIEVDYKPAKVIERSGINAFVLVASQDNHTFGIRDGDRYCGVSSFIDGNQNITIKLTDCK